MSVRIGRNARLIKGGVVIAYGKNISLKASAELIKEYSMDSTTPALTAAGKQSFTWSMEKLWVNGANVTTLLSGSAFAMVFAPLGSSPPTAPYETWNNCRILSVDKSAGESGGIIEKISGEAESVTITDS